MALSVAGRTVQRLTGQINCTQRRLMAVACNSLLDSPNRKVNVSHILVSADKASILDECQQKLESKAATFQELANQHSECIVTAKRGGIIGWLDRGQYFPSVEQAAYATPVGSMARCTSPRGHHLLLINDEREEASVQQMSVQELADLLQNPALLEEVQLVDVREAWEMETASLPGFKRLQAKDGKIDDTLDPSKQTVVLCHHGVRSMYAASFLVHQGFQQVYNVTGGIDAYSNQVDSRVPTY